MSSRLSQYVSFCTYSSGKTCISKAALERQRRDYTVYSGFCLSHRHDRDFATTFWAFGSRTRATGARRTSQAQKRGEKGRERAVARSRWSAECNDVVRDSKAVSSSGKSSIFSDRRRQSAALTGKRRLRRVCSTLPPQQPAPRQSRNHFLLRRMRSPRSRTAPCKNVGKNTSTSPPHGSAVRPSRGR